MVRRNSLSRGDIQKRLSSMNPNSSDDSRLHIERPMHGVKKGANDLLHSLLNEYLGDDKTSIQKSIAHHLEFSLAKTRFNIDTESCYRATAMAVRDRLVEYWNDTQNQITEANPKRAYYLSIEYLLGRAFQNALLNMRIEETAKQALFELGVNVEECYEMENDPGLGNGGLGRLAACFLDSMATLDLPVWGYGLRYNWGIFKQKIIDGFQCEVPDYWLNKGNPWEIERPDVHYKVKFYGYLRKTKENGKDLTVWEGGENVVAQAYDYPIPGFDTYNTINLRLWKSNPDEDFDFKSFNMGDYDNALRSRQRSEYISSVLYPNDSTDQGKELRLKQQYFFCSASVQDILRRFKKKNKSWDELPNKVAIQLNDTHPALAIIELLRILIDDEKLNMEYAFGLVVKVFSYTNHTVLPEALEKWSADLLGHLLPRHLELIYMINHQFMEQVSEVFPGDWGKMSDLSIIEESEPKKIKMANLSILGSHKINGVAYLHSELIKTTIFKSFYEMFPTKFQNKTNGVTIRRWINQCNPGISKLYTELVGSQEWLKDMEKLKDHVHVSNDPAFQKKWADIKRENKGRVQDYLKEHFDIKVDLDSLFDIQIKRIHEYKRQLMNALYLIYRYLTIKEMSLAERAKVVPRTVIFGGKAAPGYHMAKKIIKLINCIANVVNNDTEINDLLKIFFVENYNVSLATLLIPASDISQHISTAGMEASGTSNMKFVMNGGMIIGTMDGANIEICEETGQDNHFIFGGRLNDIERMRDDVFIFFIIKR